MGCNCSHVRNFLSSSDGAKTFATMQVSKKLCLLKDQFVAYFKAHTQSLAPNAKRKN